MGTVGFQKIISFRLSNNDYLRAKAHVASHSDKYEHISHLLRAAIIQKMNEEND